MLRAKLLGSAGRLGFGRVKFEGEGNIKWQQAARDVLFFAWLNQIMDHKNHKHKSMQQV